MHHTADRGAAERPWTWPMNILVFVTDDGTEAGTGPILLLRDFATSAMPPHPRGLEWKYFATVTESDEILGDAGMK
jgi:hypothetical protein